MHHYEEDSYCGLSCYKAIIWPHPPHTKKGAHYVGESLEIRLHITATTFFVNEEKLYTDYFMYSQVVMYLLA